MSLLKFKASEIVISPAEARQIIVYFFGKGNALPDYKLTFNDISFAQAVLVEATDASQEAKVNSTPPVNLVWPKPRVGKERDMLIYLIIALLTRTPNQSWWSYPKSDILARPELWPGTEIGIQNDWQQAWENRVATGVPVY